MAFCPLPSYALRHVLPAFIGPVVIGGSLAPTKSACADTPAQTRQAIQAICDRAAASYDRRDLFGFMAMYAPNFFMRSVEGNKISLRQIHDGMKIILAKNGANATGRCTISQVMPQSNGTRAIVRWHYLIHWTGSASAPAYTIERGYEALTIWKKLPRGWKETSADVTHNYLNYQR